MMIKYICSLVAILLINGIFAQNITEVQLTFTDNDGNIVSATATSNGGDFQVNQSIELMESTDYTLQVILKDGDMDITDQIGNQGENYKIFYEDSLNVFVGTIDYQDMDSNELPIGLLIFWTTNCVDEATFEGPFRTVLEDLTGVKTENSMLGDGNTIFDITWEIVLLEDPDAPPCENEEEIIDKVTLTFTPNGDGEPIIASAQDPDGPGPQDLLVDPFTLVANTTYTMDIKFESTIAGEDITEEVRGEGDEHQIYFEWTEDLFSDPVGNGNIDNASDLVNYLDSDVNGLPIGLATEWTTAESMQNGTFRVMLKHQPGIKSSMTGAGDGGTDVDIIWPVTSTVTSVDYIQTIAQDIRLLPNIVQDRFEIEIASPDFIHKDAVIVDAYGRLIQKMDINQGALQVSNLPGGIYYLQLDSPWGIIHKSFIKL